MENSTRCPKCGFVSSSYFAVCPNCGFGFSAPQQKPQQQQTLYQQPQTKYTYDQFQPPTRKSKTVVIIVIVIAFFAVITIGISTYVAVKMITSSSKKTTTEEPYKKDTRNISDSSLKAKKSTSKKKLHD
ncbi:MAG: hypothetical protein ACP5P3_08150 [Ignavibacteria bacterium]